MKQKMNIIEAYFHFKKRGNFEHVVVLSNSIDTLILDMQELHPEETINRESVMTWKFLTHKDLEKLPAEAIGKLNQLKKPTNHATRKHSK